MKKKISTLLLAVAASVGTMFASTKIGGLYYNLDATNQTAEVTSQNSSYPYWSTTITTANIPSTVTYNNVTYSVTSIGEYAFSYCSGLTSVTIGNSVTSIGDRAFWGCSRLTALTIGEGVTSIGDWAFYECTGLTSVSIPNSVTSIGNEAFWGCSSLTSVTIPNSVTSIGGNPFRNCSSLTSIAVEYENMVYDSRNNCNAIIETATNSLIAGCKRTIIPNSVTSIGNGAFRYCRGLTSVAIPNSVTSIGNEAFWCCSSLTSVTIPNSVTSIGDRAFWGCSGLSSLTIGNSVTSIGREAFRECSGLTSVHISDLNAWCKIQFPQSYSSPLYYAHNLYLNGKLVTDLVIPEGITTLGDRCFYGCTHLISATIPDGVTSIGANYFADCTGLTSVTIGSGLTSMAKEVFMNCSALTSITCKAITPPTCSGDGSGVFSNVDKSIPLDVPEGSVKDYKAANQWKDFTNILPIPSVIIPQYTVSLFVNNPSYGSVIGGGSFLQDTTITIAAIPNTGYHFAQWSDGITDNPRTIILTQDTTFTAEFAYDRVGTCGKDLALVWSYDPNANVLTIGNAGSFTENMQFGVEAPNEMEELVIGNSVTAIGSNAFAGIETLKKITIGESVKTIGEQAFYNCVNLETIFNYRPTPTNTYSNAFDGVDKFECMLYVLPSSIDMYKAAAVWRDFYYTYAIGAEEATLLTNEVNIEPLDNAAIVTWPTSDNAATYTLQITKDGVVFCTLIFNGNGQLTGIAFAPGKNGNRHAPAAKMTANGLQFTVTGLNSATHYALTLQAKDDQDAVLASYNSEFTTTGTATAIDEVQGDNVQCTKVLRDGQIFILRGDKTFTLQGQEVK